MKRTTVEGGNVIRPRLRVEHQGDIAIGPGKAALLRHIADTGSITQAAKLMGMSYMRAWMLIRTMNRCFKEPLVKSVRGGSSGGGAELTITGKKLLDLYESMEAKSLNAIRLDWKKVQELLRNP